MLPLRRRDLLGMAVRASMLQSTFNYERQQGIGWAWSLLPALRRLHPDPLRRRERVAEHTAYFNTQPTMASLALGAVAQLEERRASGEPMDPAVIGRTKSVLGSALAALGDRLFWFTLRPFAACFGVLLAADGSWTGALGLWLCYNLFHQGVRLLGVGWGYAQGPAVLGEALRKRLARLTRLLSVLGVALVGVTIAALLAPGGMPRALPFQVALAAGLGGGLVAGQRSRPTPTEWAIGAGALCVVAALWTS